MNNDPKILACVDTTQIADVVADYAAWAARKLQAPLEFLHVLNRHSELPGGQDHSGAIGLDAQEKLLTKLGREDEARTRDAREAGRVFLNRLRERAIATGVTLVDARLRHGDVEETLAEQQDGARLLVLGRAGTSSEPGGKKLGRHLEWVIRAVNLPVLVANNAYKEPSHVLFAFDGSAVTRRGVEMLATSSLLSGLPIHLVMSGAAANGQGQRLLENAVQMLKNAGVEATSALIPGNAQDVIIDALKTKPFDFLVMGAYSHSPIRSLFLGSKTSDLLKDSKVATFLLR